MSWLTPWLKEEQIYKDGYLYVIGDTKLMVLDDVGKVNEIEFETVYSLFFISYQRNKYKHITG